MLSPDYSKRHYLLPKGCKDLIDVIRLEEAQKAQMPSFPEALNQPPASGIIFVSNLTTVRELAALLGQKTFKIIADAMQLGVFATANQVIDFNTISRIARSYGIEARKTR
jgi:hypothetical protein